jgi:FixJ family two-component response regulator
MQLIALVDDDAHVRHAIGRLLRLESYGVAEYCSGAAFLAAMEELQPRCIVLDLHMPALNGFDVQQVLARSSTVPVIALTGSADSDDCARAIRLGAVTCLVKPVDAARLLDAIREVCAHHQEREG